MSLEMGCMTISEDAPEIVLLSTWALQRCHDARQSVIQTVLCLCEMVGYPENL
jgi:hypothetical protein